MLREMYLRAYARARQNSPEGSDEAVCEDAGFRVTMTLTAPLLALGIVVGAFVNRVAPGTFTRDSPYSIFFVALIVAMCFAVRVSLRHRFRSLTIPSDCLRVYSAPGQRLRFWIETAFGVVCIIAAGILVGVIRRST